MKRPFPSILLTAVALVGMATALPAAAQETTAPQAAVDQDSAEIIVTATRRASPLSDVPIAVSATSA